MFLFTKPFTFHTKCMCHIQFQVTYTRRSRHSHHPDQNPQLNLTCSSCVLLVVKHVPVPIKEIVKVPYHIKQPYPVEKHVHVPVHVPVDRPVPYKVLVPQPYPVEKEVHVPYKVPYAGKSSCRVRAKKNYMISKIDENLLLFSQFSSIPSRKEGNKSANLVRLYGWKGGVFFRIFNFFDF